MATTRSSAQYTKLHVNKYAHTAHERGGRVVPVAFEHIVVSGETGGASAGVQDLVNLCVVRAQEMVVGLTLEHEAMGASAGSGVTLDIGDSGDPDRLISGKDVDAAAITNDLLATGFMWTPTADTVIQARWKTANPVVGKIIRGTILVVPKS